MTDRIYKTHGVDVLDDMIRHLSEALRDVGLSPDVAEDAGVETFNRLSCHWGGQLIYFPKGVRVRVSRRNRAIYSDFDGHNQTACLGACMVDSQESPFQPSHARHCALQLVHPEPLLIWGAKFY